jgi:hypothetical protein
MLAEGALTQAETNATRSEVVGDGSHAVRELDCVHLCPAGVVVVIVAVVVHIACQSLGSRACSSPQLHKQKKKQESKKKKNKGEYSWWNSLHTGTCSEPSAARSSRRYPESMLICRKPNANSPVSCMASAISRTSVSLTLPLK